MGEQGFGSFSELLAALSLGCPDLISHCRGSKDPQKLNCCHSVVPLLNMKQNCFLMSGFITNASWFSISLKFDSANRTVSFPDSYLPVKSISVEVIDPNREILDEQVIQVARNSLITAALEPKVFIDVNNPPRYNCREEETYDRYQCAAECLGVGRSCICNEGDLLNHSYICDPWQSLACRLEPSLNGKDCWDTKLFCPRNCRAHTFDIRYSVTEYETDEGMAIMEFQFSKWSRQFTEIRQYFAVDFGLSITRFGGQLSLFLGCSVMSFIHVILFCIDKMVSRIPKVGNEPDKPESNELPI